MLSKQIGEEAGQVTGTRVLPDEGAGPQVEMSIQESGTLLGVPVSEMCTFASVIRPDGTLFAHGQGVATTDDGEMAPWQGQGAGRFTGHGTASSWRGAIYFQTTACTNPRHRPTRPQARIAPGPCQRARNITAAGEMGNSPMRATGAAMHALYA
jgi:hypothetical protein